MNVIKIGGAEGNDTRALCREVAAATRAGERLVLVHGGSAEANRLGSEVGHPPQFLTSPSGHTSRRTDARTLEVFLMATALVNRRLVAQLQSSGVDAVGLSGIDGGLLRAERKRALRAVENGRVRVVRDDYSGRPTSVDAELLGLLLDAGRVPVIAPIGLSAEHDPLNLDGDRAAAAIAGALGAETFVILTAVPGVLRDFPDPRSLIEHVPASGTDELLDLAEGRMKKKVLGAREALTAGVQRVVIASSQRTEPLRSALAGRGTVIGAAIGAAISTAAPAV